MRTRKDLEITTKGNPVYKELKDISKRKSSYILIEGKKLFQEVIRSPLKVEKVYIDKQNEAYFSNLLSKCHNHELVFMKNDLISSVFTTDNEPTSNDLILALAKKPSWQLKDILETKKNLILLEKIQDPGNLGTIIRSALAFDLGGIILTSGSVEPFNTKVIRASAGAVCSVPVITVTKSGEVINNLRKEGYKIIATSPKATKKLGNFKYQSPSIFLFGNEGRGLSTDLLNYADQTITIPQTNKVESLNLATSVSLLLWELYKS